MAANDPMKVVESVGIAFYHNLLLQLLDDKYTPSVYISTSDYDSLSETEKNNGTAYFLTDDTKISAVTAVANAHFNPKGSIALASLPSSGMSEGDYYFITDDGSGRFYDGSAWKVVY